MDAEQSHALPDVENLEQYIQNRVRLLLKSYTDHVAWDAALKAPGARNRLFQAWVDDNGAKRTTIIDRAYLAIHWRIIRSLILDLADCGSEGKNVLHKMSVTKPADKAG